MSAKGKARKDALRVRRSKRQAEASGKVDESAKKQKKAAQQTEHEHEVMEKISLNGNSLDNSGIGKSQERPEGIIRFDSIFKDVQLDFAGSTTEIEPLKCGDEGLAVHLPKQIQEKNLKSPVH